jgi:hypothetical protein
MSFHSLIDRKDWRKDEQEEGYSSLRTLQAVLEKNHRALLGLGITVSILLFLPWGRLMSPAPVNEI